MADYFSEREGVAVPRDQEDLGLAFWGGFIELVRTCVDCGLLVEAFPRRCPDLPHLPWGVDEEALGRTLLAHVHLGYPFKPKVVPPTLQILDGVEFFARRVSRPSKSSRHDYFDHEHITRFDRDAGVGLYQSEVNELLRRNGHPYELQGDGLRVERTTSPALQDIVTSEFATGDGDLDVLLSVACEKFRNPDAATRMEALEKLWDAFERLKTLHVATAKNKKASMEQVLAEAVPEATLRARVDAEALALTSIGNDFRIRHHEQGKVAIERDEHVDYLFHRLLALIWMILKARGALT